MAIVINQDKGLGFYNAVLRAGRDLEYRDGQWRTTPLVNETQAQADAAVQGIYDAYDMLAELRVLRKEALAQACQAAIMAGIDHAATGQTLHYPADETSQRNLAAQTQKAQLLADTGEPYKFMTLHNNVWERRDHTAAQITDVGVAMADHVSAQLSVLDNLRAQVDAAGSPEAIAAVGYPILTT
jgi:hypothetical protein